MKSDKVIQMRNEDGEAALELLVAKLKEFSNVSEQRMIEIGSYGGESTVIFAKHFGKVYAIDPFIDDYDLKDPTCKFAPMSEVQKVFKNRIAEFKNVSHIQLTSDDAVKCFEEIDFVYIDGNHAYEQVRKDILNYLPLLKKGSFIGGHDFANSSWIGVVKAVRKTLGEPDFIFPDFSWLKQIK